MINKEDITNIIEKNKHHKKWVMLLAAILLAFLVYHFVSSGNGGKKAGNPKAIRVVEAVAKTADVPVYLTSLGSIIPEYTVTIRTQIDGILTKVNFADGQKVKKDDLLAEIDSRALQAQLTQYQGQLKRDQALLENARIDLKRYETLWSQNSVSKQILDTQIALVHQYEGAVLLDQGQVNNAKVNLSYCKIPAPFDGVVGIAAVTKGNLVQTSDPNGIVILNTINPITAIFTIPETDLPKLMRQAQDNPALTVEAYDRSQNQLLATGKLAAIDNQIDLTTGTLKLKALFANDENLLYPNQFVNIKLLIDNLTNVVVVPTAAVQHGPKNDFVYLLNEDKTNVTVTPIVTGPNFDHHTVIVSGVTDGQFVVTEGVDKLTDGAPITLLEKKSSEPKK